MHIPLAFALALATTAHAATKYTTTSTHLSYHTLPTPACHPLTNGNLHTVAATYTGCPSGCHPIQVPGAFGPAKSNSPYICSAREVVETSTTKEVKVVTCGAGSTVREMTPAYGKVWPKCTGGA